MPPKARITIPNARAGERFSSPVAIILDEGGLATIRDVVFPRDIGLSYKKEQGLLTGIPTESGDIELSVLWSCTSHDECETKLLFVVNPDPRSLWKVIEPPADAPYPKSHLDAAGLVRDNIRIAAASRRGALMSMPGASEMMTSISTTARKQDGLSCWSQTGPVVQ
jgi:hypothetical protein